MQWFFLTAVWCAAVYGVLRQRIYVVLCGDVILPLLLGYTVNVYIERDTRCMSVDVCGVDFELVLDVVYWYF